MHRCAQHDARAELLLGQHPRRSLVKDKIPTALRAGCHQHVLMAVWQYGYLTVGNKRERVIPGGLLSKERTVTHWTLQWYPPGEKMQTVEQADLPKGVPLTFLNKLGSQGWEVLSTVRYTGGSEYILKRPRAVGRPK